ncbi:hypothetical protein B6A10_03210 [Flavobacterium sp. L1I52]|uniref:Uncharacterized protein n=1 Tax=Flavobacterium pokkalii TaxID=1940408 RepID=A0ABR7UN60_9FLAO|nr:hypothetical protein [Flavobacterium pokkalii]
MCFGNQNELDSPDRSGILCLVFLTRQRYSAEQEGCLLKKGSCSASKKNKGFFWKVGCKKKNPACHANGI